MYIRSALSCGRTFFWMECTGERPEFVLKVIGRYRTKVWLPETPRPVLRPASYDDLLDFIGAFPRLRQKYPIAGLAERMAECYIVFDVRHGAKSPPPTFQSGRLGSEKQPVIVPAVRL